MQKELETAFIQHPVRNHLFLDLFEQGKINTEQVKAYFEQQYYLSVNFPSTIAAVYARVPDKYWKEKRHLIDLIDVEAWGSNSNKSHDTHFRNVCHYLGIDMEKTRIENPRPYTHNYVADRMDLYLNYPIETVLSAVAYNEKLFLHMIQKMYLGLNKIKGCENIPKEYFELHLKDEPHDFALFYGLLNLTVENEHQIKNATQGVQKIMDFRNHFFDGLMQDIMHL